MNITKMPLHYKIRPQALQNKIDELFHTLSQKNESTWTILNGSSEYRMCGVSDTKFAKHIVESNPGLPAYYFMDVGAGGYQWVDNITNLFCVGGKTSLTKYHIVGLNGEGVDEITAFGNCYIYKLGGFKIENMVEAFAERGLDFHEKFDLIVSRWTLTHLIDPLGTFLQMYSLTKLNGFLMSDGIFLNRKTLTGQQVYGETMSGFNLDLQHLAQIDLETSYLMCPTDSIRSTRTVLIQKTQPISSIDSLSYSTDDFMKSKVRISVTTNSSDKLPKCITDKPMLDTCGFFSGNQKLFNELKDNNLFTTDEIDRQQHGRDEYMQKLERCKYSESVYRTIHGDTGFQPLCEERDLSGSNTLSAELKLFWTFEILL